MLDMACGQGTYSFHFLEQGATFVHGMDLSADAISVAKAKQQSLEDGSKEKIMFSVADACHESKFAGGPFDLVFAAWLLDNAPDKETMIRMLRTAHMNLKEKGHFVAVTPVATNDPASQLKAELAARPPHVRQGGVFCRSFEEIPDGLAVRYVYYSPGCKDEDIDAYFLRKEVYESAAKESGFGSMVTWERQHIPSHFLSGETPVSGSSVAELQTYEEVPVFSIMIMVKE